MGRWTLSLGKPKSLQTGPGLKNQDHPVCFSPVFPSPGQLSLLGYYYYLFNPFENSKSRCSRPYSPAETTFLKKKKAHKERKKNTQPAVLFLYHQARWDLAFVLYTFSTGGKINFKRHGSLEQGKKSLGDMWCVYMKQGNPTFPARWDSTQHQICLLKTFSFKHRYTDGR